MRERDKLNLVVVRTGIANTASILAAFNRLGYDAVLSENPETVREADAVVLPGVGAFASGMNTLRNAELLEPLRQRLTTDKPTLCICLGMQLLFEGSEEAPGVAGLSVLPGVVERFRSPAKVPQLGWNEVLPDRSFSSTESGFAYFANSYCVRSGPDGWAHAHTDYNGGFISAIQKGSLLACQFHPELSGTWGAGLLRSWLNLAEERFLDGGDPC